MPIKCKMTAVSESTTTRTAGGLDFSACRREKTGARSGPVDAGEIGCEAPGLENPINHADP